MFLADLADATDDVARIPKTFRITFGTRYPHCQFIRLFAIFYMLWPLEAAGAIASFALVSGAFAYLQRRPRIQVAALVIGRTLQFSALYG